MKTEGTKIIPAAGTAALLLFGIATMGSAVAGECTMSSADLKGKVTGVVAQAILENMRVPDRNLSVRVLTRTAATSDALAAAEWQTATGWKTVTPRTKISHEDSMPAPASADVTGNAVSSFMNMRLEMKPPASVASCEFVTRTLVYANNERLTEFLSASCANPDGSPVTISCSKSLNNRNSTTPRWEVTYKVMDALTPTAQ